MKWKKAAVVYDAIVSILAVAVIVYIAVSGASLVNAIGGWLCFMTVWICVIATDIRTLKLAKRRRRKKMNDNTKAIAETIYQELKKHKVAMTEYYAEQVATALDSAGYRKQSDTVREFAEKLKKECHKAIAHNDKAMHNMEKVDEMWYICSGQNDGLHFVLKTMNELAEQYGKEEK